MQIMIEHEERCEDVGGDDGMDEPCPICRGDVSDEFLAWVEQAASQPGKTMTPEEFSVWLDSLGTGSPDQH